MERFAGLRAIAGVTMNPEMAPADASVPGRSPDPGGIVGDGAVDHPDLSGADVAGIFGDLFDRHARDLYRYLAARVGASLADDLVADAFVTALRRRETYDPVRGTARSWLFGIATNELRHHQRAESRHHAATVRLTGQFASISGPEDRAVEKVDAADAVRRLAGALQRLSDLDRDLLLLNSWAQLDPAEIAVAVGIPAGTVRTRLHRIRVNLRRAAVQAGSAGDVIPLYPAAERGIDHG